MLYSAFFIFIRIILGTPIVLNDEPVTYIGATMISNDTQIPDVQTNDFNVSVIPSRLENFT
jgi:hypothetical protein